MENQVVTVRLQMPFSLLREPIAMLQKLALSSVEDLVRDFAVPTVLKCQDKGQRCVTTIGEFPREHTSRFMAASNPAVVPPQLAKLQARSAVR